MYDYENTLLPKFPRTQHLPVEPNATRDDLIAPLSSLSVLESYTLSVEEKIDGANCGITIYNGEPLVRNRNHILNKGYGRKDTPAKNQYAPLWNWFYYNADRFYKLEKELGYMPSVYGEWLYARHTIEYDLLPEYFIAYDIYSPVEKTFLCTDVYRDLLTAAGFTVIPRLSVGPITVENLISFRDGTSVFSTHMQREGIYLKTMNKEGYMGERYKMVRNHFITDDHWNNKSLVKTN
jgi:hypothetical protein